MRIAKIILISAPAVHVGLDILRDDLRLADVYEAEPLPSEIAHSVAYAGECSHKVCLVARILHIEETHRHPSVDTVSPCNSSLWSMKPHNYYNSTFLEPY